MKKIFTLMFALGAVTISFAQQAHFDNRETRNLVVNSNHDVFVGHNDIYSQKNDMIQKINREFDFKIMQVNRNPYLRNGEKRRQVRMLEQQRAQQIAQVNARFMGMRDHDYGYRK